MPCIISSTVVAFNCFSMRVPLGIALSLGFLGEYMGFMALFASFQFPGFGLGLGCGLGRGRCDKTFADFDGGAVAGDVTDQLAGKRRADQGLVGGGCQLGVGELGEGAGEG